MSEREIVKKQVYSCREYLKITRKVKAMVVKKTGGTAGTVQVLHPYTCQPLGYQWFMNHDDGRPNINVTSAG